MASQNRPAASSQSSLTMREFKSLRERATTAEDFRKLATWCRLKAEQYRGSKASLEAELGSIEVGKRADVALVRLDGLHSTPVTDVVSALVYSAEAEDVDTVIIDGQVVMRERELVTIDERETIETAKREAEKLAADLHG